MSSTVIDVHPIVTDRAILAGIPCIAGTRIPVTTILGLLWEGVSTAEVLADNTQLVNDDVLASVQHAAGEGSEPGIDLA